MCLHLIINVGKICYETALKSNVKGHRLQFIPFFWYLLQHLLLGFIQLEVQAKLQAVKLCVF